MAKNGRGWPPRRSVASASPRPLGSARDLIVNIQPRVFEQVSLANAAPHRAAHLVAAIRREGLVW
jgi:hypothetical protein